jgi:hypothetical protein
MRYAFATLIVLLIGATILGALWVLLQISPPPEGTNVAINATNPPRNPASSPGASVPHFVTHHDTSHNTMDAHAGNILQVGDTYYLYGESHQCGFRPGTPGSPWCGVTVYHSNDRGQTWTFDGYLFDGATPAWQARCAPTANTYVGCYEPKMLYNAVNNNYVMWIAGESETPLAIDTEYVLTCTSPTGGATPATPGTGCTLQPSPAFPTTAPGPPGFMVDASGNGYVVYDDLANDYEIMVMELNASYTAPTGPATDTGVRGEGLSAFITGGKAYIVYGAKGCGFCSATPTSYVSAPTPLATYGSAVQINTTSCNGQPNHGADLLSNGGAPFVLMGTDQWIQTGSEQGIANQSLANAYFGALTITAAGAINPFACDPIQDAPDTPQSRLPQPPGADQSDIADVFQDRCDIGSAMGANTSRLQTFVPTRPVLRSISLVLMQNNTQCSVAIEGCAAPNADLILSLVTLDGSNTPVNTLASTRISPSSLSWAGKWTTWNVNHAVSPGAHYGIELSSTTTVGCFGTTISAIDLTAPYAAGIERYNNGSGWTTENGRSLMFATE